MVVAASAIWMGKKKKNKSIPAIDEVQENGTAEQESEATKNETGSEDIDSTVLRIISEVILELVASRAFTSY